VLFSDPNNQNPFGTKSLEFGGGGEDPNSSNYGRLSEKLNEADIERRKDREAADQRERAHEIRREERQKKIDFMVNMPDSTPAGTGKSSWDRSCVAVTLGLLIWPCSIVNPG
jgi:hypothetical protein